MDVARGSTVFYQDGSEEVAARVSDIRVKESKIELRIEDSSTWMALDTVSRVEEPKAPRVCLECGKALQNHNKYGYCYKHAEKRPDRKKRKPYDRRQKTTKMENAHQQTV